MPNHFCKTLLVAAILLLQSACVQPAAPATTTPSPTRTPSPSPSLSPTSTYTPTLTLTPMMLPSQGPNGEVFQSPEELEQQDGWYWILQAEDIYTTLQTISMDYHVNDEIYLDGSSFSSVRVTDQTCQLVLPNDSYCQTDTESLRKHFVTGDIVDRSGVYHTETLVLFPKIWVKFPDQDWSLYSEDAGNSMGVSSGGLEALKLSPYIVEPRVLGVLHDGDQTVILVLAQVNVAEYYAAITGLKLEVLREQQNQVWFYIDQASGQLIRDEVKLSFFTPAEVGITKEYIVYFSALSEYFDFDAPASFPSLQELSAPVAFQHIYASVSP